MGYRIYSKLGVTTGTYYNLKKLTPIYKNSPEFHYRLYSLANRQKKWEKALNHIDDAIKLSKSNSSAMLYKNKAECLGKMGEKKESLSCLEVYLKGYPKDSSTRLKQANEYLRLMMWKDAVESYEKYLILRPEDSATNYQLGECYFQLNKFGLAEQCFSQASKKHDYKCDLQSLAKAHYKLGLMQLINNKNKESSDSFASAIKYDRKLNSKRFGIGVFHEHFKQIEHTLEAYKDTFLQKSNDADLAFKIASLLDRMSKPEQALTYYKQALKIDKVRSPWCFALANCFEQLNDFENAELWYKRAIERQDKHRAFNYRRLGYALKQLGKKEESLAAYKEAELFNSPVYFSQSFYSEYTKMIRVRYAIYYEHCHLNDKMIFYESLDGRRMTGNPYAIFKVICNRNDFKEYKHVWVVSSFDFIPHKYRAMDNIIFVKKNSDAYLKYITSAKYLISNNTFSDYVVRKPKQLYLQTTHGIFYKTVGRESSGTPLGVGGGTRNLLQATHIIVPNDYMAEKLQKSYSIAGINSGAIAKVGYPRIDLTLNASSELKQQMILNLNIDTSKKTVFYAPTWRGESKNNKWFNSDRLYEDLKKLADLDINVIFRSHTETEELLKDIKIPDKIIIPNSSIQTNELLSITDTLITDYSSVFFDFIVTERPIIHYLYDIEEYTQQRGLNLTEADLPGTIAKNREELVLSVLESLNINNPSESYIAAKKRFCPYEDGKSSDRVIDWFFLGRESEIDLLKQSSPARLSLTLGGMLSENLPVSSFVTKLNSFKMEDNTSSIVLNKEIEKDDNKVSTLKRLKKDINIIINSGVMPKTVEESVAIEHLNRHGIFINKHMEDEYRKVFMREARRLFGDSKFDIVYNCEEKSYYWNGLLVGIKSKDR